MATCLGTWKMGRWRLITAFVAAGLYRSCYRCPRCHELFSVWVSLTNQMHARTAGWPIAGEDHLPRQRRFVARMVAGACPLLSVSGQVARLVRTNSLDVIIKSIWRCLGHFHKHTLCVRILTA